MSMVPRVTPCPSFITHCVLRAPSCVRGGVLGMLWGTCQVPALELTL